MTSDTLSDMNKISFYFSELVKELQKQFEGQPLQNNLTVLLSILYNHFEKLLLEDKKFLDRISNCSANFSALNLVVNRNVNKTENTLKTIQCCMNHGIIVWTKKEDDKVSFQIKTYIPESNDQSFSNRGQSVYEESKGTVRKGHIVSPTHFLG